MTTTITPALGAAPLYTQGGTGASPGYNAVDLRRMLLVGALQEGAVEADAYKVTQRAGGANMSVDIDADAGFCVIQGDHVTAQGLYPVAPHTANINETITTADATLPRIDQVVLELLDNTHDSSGGNLVRTRVIAGTPTSGATLDNRNGAAALPSSCMRLADVLVGAGVSSITTANIRDRRTWARGARYRLTRSLADYTTSSTSFSAVDGTNLKPRVECSGAELCVKLLGVIEGTSNTVGTTQIRMYQDGSYVTGTERQAKHGDGATTFTIPLNYEWYLTPTAGSHTFEFYWAVSAGATALRASSDRYLQMVVEEVVRQNASNG